MKITLSILALATLGLLSSCECPCNKPTSPEYLEGDIKVDSLRSF